VIFYLPHNPDSYRLALDVNLDKKRTVSYHEIVENGKTVLISPTSLSFDILHPQNFINMKEILSIERIWLIDYVRRSEKLIQIVDHRNLTGKNPLAGRTPIGNRPRFPDVSHIYMKENVGLPQRVVNTVGPDRFRKLSIQYGSEVAVFVALCAAYAGIDVIGIGWNKKKRQELYCTKSFCVKYYSVNK